MQKTKIEIINETVEYYSQDPNGRRGIDKNGMCLYLTPDGKMCAVGRCCIEPKNEWVGDAYNQIDTNTSFHYIDHLLKDEYKGHKVPFWYDLQCLHDDDSYWVDNGLTEKGKIFQNLLLTKYA